MARRAIWLDDIDLWRTHMKTSLTPKNTMNSYLGEARRVYEFGLEHQWPTNPRKLEPDHVYQYYESILGLSSKSQSSYMAALVEFLRFTKNPCAPTLNINIRAERGEVHWLEEEQASMMLSTAPNLRLMAAEIIWLYTGIRDHELRLLRTGNVTDNWLIVSSGKGRKGRKIPIDKEFWEMLSPYLEWKTAWEKVWGKTDYFLAHPKGSHWGYESGPLLPYSSGRLSNQAMEHGLSLGITGTSAHAFRRTFGRSLYKNGCPPTQIQIYYGHATLEQTMSYIGITEEMSAEAMRKYRSSYIQRVKVQKT